MKAAKTVPKPAPSTRRENAVHARLSVEKIAELDKLAEANGITRAALIAIACTRIIKSGL